MSEVPPPALVEAASWALASGLARRHPELTIMRHHPGGGLYDCLAIRSDAGLHIDLNRVGRIHVHASRTGSNIDWEPVEWIDFLMFDQREFIEGLERAAGLPHVNTLPPSIPRVLTYRLLAAFAELHAFGRPVEISMSTSDTSGYGSGPAEWSSRYPSVARQLAADPLGFWCASSRDSEFVIETETAMLHRRDGSPVSLPLLYNDEGRALERLVGRLLTA